MQTRYSFAGLAVAGAVSGVVAPKHLWAHYLGAVLGQAANELAFLNVGSAVYSRFGVLGGL